jgi:hypothetical protein
LLFPTGQPAVAVVQTDGKVEIRNVNITHDLGTGLQVSGAVSESDQLIINPSPNLVAGTVVTIVDPGHPNLSS